MRISSLLFLLCLTVSLTVSAQEFSPRYHGHSHNDYTQKNPLQQALNLGFGSIEVDVFYYHMDLVVSHVGIGLGGKPTIQDLYFEPLREYMQEHAAEFLPPNKPLEIMIDFKSDGGDQSYYRLKELVDSFPGLFQVYEEGELVPGPVQLIISGNRPIRLITNDENRVAVLDGRISDLESNAPAYLFPRISASYNSVLKWNGKGEMPADQYKILAGYVNTAAAEGKQFRLWAAPNTEAWWNVCSRFENMLVNVDDLDGFVEFCNSQSEKP